MIDAEWVVRELGPTTSITLFAAWVLWGMVKTQVKDLKAEVITLGAKLDHCESDRVETARQLGKLEGRIEAQEKRDC